MTFTDIPATLPIVTTPINRLRLRHQEVIRLAFAGTSNVAIAESVGLTYSSVIAILRSPLAQAELARLKSLADEKLADVPLRARVAMQLTEAAVSSVRVNRSLMEDSKVRPSVRSGIARHFMDRVIFQTDGSGDGGGYRAILEKLTAIERGLGTPSIGVEDAEIVHPNGFDESAA